jgi:hypothetical protein
MSVTARGVALFCGVILGGFGLLGLLITPDTPGETNFLLASWPLPIVLLPGAALAAALDASASRSVSGQSAVVWPAFTGLAVYGAVTGYRWLDASSRATQENVAGLFMLLVIAVHAVGFIVGGGLLALFPRTRPAGFQIWLAYPVLLGSWVLGSLVART